MDKHGLGWWLWGLWDDDDDDNGLDDEDDDDDDCM